MTIIISLASDTVFTNAWNSEPKAISTVQVLERHGFDQSRLARTGLSNHIDMQKPIIVFDTEDAIIVAKIDAGKASGMTCIHIMDVWSLWSYTRTRLGVLPKKLQP